MSSILKEVDEMTDDRASTPPRSFSIVTKQRITIDDPVFLTCDACDLVGNPTHLSSSLFCASQQCSAIDQIRLDSSGTRTAVLRPLSRFVSSLREFEFFSSAAIHAGKQRTCPRHALCVHHDFDFNGRAHHIIHCGLSSFSIVTSFFSLYFSFLSSGNHMLEYDLRMANRPIASIPFSTPLLLFATTPHSFAAVTKSAITDVG